MTPKVKFDLNKELDIQMTYNFLGWSIGGVNFDESIFGTNPGLRDVDTNNIYEIDKYFSKEYTKQKDILNRAVHIANSIWEPIESEFLHKILEVFKGYEFPAGKYICYLSITDCNPRFLEDKTFQMYYKAMVPTRTISHELTHFLFYDYTLNKHANIFAGLNPNKGIYWSLAELFNNVILSQDEFVKLLNNYGDGAYPNHEKHFKPLVDLWDKSMDIDVFIPKAFKYLKENLEK